MRKSLVGAWLRLAVAGPRTITVAVLADDFVRVEADRLGDGLTPRVSVLANNVDSLRNDGVCSSSDRLVIQNDGLRWSLEVPVQVEACLGASSVGIVGVIVPPNNHQTPPVVEVPHLVSADATVRRAEAGRYGADDLPQRIFHQLHLSVQLLIVELADVRVAPSVHADLMSSFVGVSQRIDRSLVVDAAIVVAVDKEGSLLATRIAERIDDLAFPGVRTIVKGHGQAP